MTTAKKTPAKAAAAAPAPKTTPAKKPQVRRAGSARPQAVPEPAVSASVPAKSAAAAPTAAAKPERVAKAKKPKLVRDSFTIPKLEYAVLEELKQRSHQLMQPAKKSELLRAGIKALAAMSDVTLLASLKAVPAIKTGRPAKD